MEHIMASRRSLAPIALFAYNRADVLNNTIAALEANDLADQSDLYVFLDVPKPGNSRDA